MSKRFLQIFTNFYKKEINLLFVNIMLFNLTNYIITDILLNKIKTKESKSYDKSVAFIARYN